MGWIIKDEKKDSNGHMTLFDTWTGITSLTTEQIPTEPHYAHGSDNFHHQT
jgi:hypothetical protein